jgi:hypothetical protein
MQPEEAQKIIQCHWNYFLAIEQDMNRLSRFIEFDERNYCAFSIEMARIIMIASAEVDVVMKGYCKELSPSKHPDTIDKYKKIITGEFPDFFISWIKLPQYGFGSLLPWKDWAHKNSPDWWLSNNNIKHSRHEYFYQANLQNALYSVSGLFALLNHFKIKLEEVHHRQILSLSKPLLFEFMGTRDP